ncbi:conserved hypothetical protein [Theileria orientalis strain Shintoku]|uniref:Uncharacterized protein n=1 Tax=Theileria orientalis strain Shintoku TaxID=869250 RepID=J4CCT8_THEOR|nr:conserved hypothetical protein [Theileria orientalis strain Shintoku]BAM39967.1 conserved hypothetical protein [Theileria orientalis strain Shintoku]|eukprot:XP_009690268.1 conserved hypothetical protein [Theileria orientalis strain Shintoku]
MFKPAAVIRKVKNEFALRNHIPTKDDENTQEPETNYIPITALRMPYPIDMPNGYKILQNPNCFFKRRFLTGVSSCKNISFIRANENFDLNDDSLQDLMKMLKFKSEPCYQRPYRLIADSKLCLKGNCDTVSKILRPGW